ncbi:hypothetical protein M433DRAFT_150960 [Acidomyces richmondensis BFW]|nr:MAG: hypothetical protein FE78DRAFT_93888 [Acidomyces sp. 'richmondensis']KYG48524.1 hypothetical protein M433DRAFT_150960 [Acidomyces richmondensis BFW]
MPTFHFSDLRRKRSQATIGVRAGKPEKDDSDISAIPESRDGQSVLKEDGRVRASRKEAVQNFFRTTKANIKAKGAHLQNASAIRLPQRTKTSCVSKSSPKRNSQQRRTLDIKDEVLDRLMGPTKDMSSGRIQSNDFFLKQRIRASSRAASAGQNPLENKSQKERDRRPLSQIEVDVMFAGAPYFTVEKTEIAYIPHIAFNGSTGEEGMKACTDHRSLAHESFEACSLWGSRFDHHHGSDNTIKAWALEMPNMLSANGLDCGTVGFEYFLQRPVADSKAFPEEPIFLNKRKLLYSNPEQLGLRELNLELLIDRLSDLAELHAMQQNQSCTQFPWTDEQVEEMGEGLFRRILDAELGTTPAGTGCVTMNTQVTALQKVLGEAHLWYDFSQVEFRTRAGQLLWEVNEPSEEHAGIERDLLLLQITLAAELLVRLAEIRRHKSAQKPNQSDNEVRTSSKPLSRKLRWDLILATTFLENIDVSVQPTEKLAKQTNRVSLFSATSFFTAKESSLASRERVIIPVLAPRYPEKQLAGLMRFANSLHWPHAQDIQRVIESKLFDLTGEKVSENELKLSRPVSGISGLTTFATPLSSPGLPTNDTVTSHRQSFLLKEPGIPGLTRISTASSIPLCPTSSNVGADGPREVGGWLSHSWLSGFVLPGESASHFLISTMLENSAEAIKVLGEGANLYGGFIYRGKYYWSKACVVGRVLAASKNATECMGWISSPTHSKSLEDGWFAVEVKSMLNPPTPARIKAGDLIAKDSDPLHGAKISVLHAGDFITHFDGPPVIEIEVTLESVTFKPVLVPAEEQHETMANASAKNMKTVEFTFSSLTNNKLENLIIPICYDVTFIASYPCYPQRSWDHLKSHAKTNSSDEKLEIYEQQSLVPEKYYPETESSQSAKTNPDFPPNTRDLKKELPQLPAHPLHVEYSYVIVPAATLFTLTPETMPKALSKAEDRKRSESTVVPSEDVIVLDCRGSGDLELLARAWCAKVGENAIVGRTGRTCMSCCIREAKALAVGVVIRI